MSYDLETAQKKLRDNREPQEHLRAFISGFADRLNGEEDAQGLALALMLFSYDVERGVDGFTDKPMPGRLARFPKRVASLMVLILVRDLRLYFPEDLAIWTEREFKLLHLRSSKAKAL